MPNYSVMLLMLEWNSELKTILTLTMPFKFNKNAVFVIAEIGGNHEGDFEYAQRLLKQAANSGADAAKFQVYSGDKLVSRIADPERNKHFDRFALTIDQYEQLAQMAKDLEIMFMASIWDRESLARLDRYIAVHKIGSGDFNAYELVEAIIRTGKPIIQSCGLATIEEIEDYVDFVKSIDPDYIEQRKLCLLQCTVMYPIPDEQANLNAMRLIADRTHLPVGYSDHTLGTYAAEIAVAMGAQVIEMHFTDEREGKTFRDHQLSVTQHEMQQFVTQVDKIKTLQGSYDKQLMPIEIENNHPVFFRRAIYPLVDLAVGEQLARNNVTSLRPNKGIDARDYFNVLGKTLKVAKKAHEPIFWNDLES